MSLPQATDPFGALPTAQPGPADAPTPASTEERTAALERAGAQAREQLGAWLLRARARARWLLLAQLGAYALAWKVAALLAGAGLAAALGATAGRALVAALLLSGLGLLLLWGRRSRLARAALGRDRSALARLLVQGAPAASSSGSELLSSIEVQRAPPQGASTALLSLLHQRAAKTALAIDLAAALPVRTLRGSLLGLLSALLCALAVAWGAPHALRLGGLRLWLGEAATPPPEPEPIAGDLSITYLYPAYTGLPPRVEEGTPGDLRGPKGTQVKLAARADRDLVQAFAVVDGEAIPLEATGAGHRQLSGTLSLKKNGHWRLRFADKKGRAVAEGPDRAIELTADQPPQAIISDPAQSTVEVDPLGKLPIIWSATDDYGLGKVALVYQRPGEPEQRIELAAPEAGSVVRRQSGSYAWQMGPLELREGDSVSFHLEALDQNAVDGPQRGSSATHALKIFSAAEHHKDGIQRAQVLWERLVSLLGDRLVEKASGESDWYSQTQQRDQRAQQLIVELHAAGVELGKDKLAPRALGRALKYVAAGMSPLLQRTQLARAPLSKGIAGKEGAVRLFATALANEVREEEKDVLYLEDLLDQARIEDLQELQREIKRSREELSRLGEKLRKAPDEATKKQLMAEVQRMKERVQELMKRMAEMAKGINDEHLNSEAVESVQKQQDLMSQLSDMQKKMQSGDVDGALKDLEKLSQDLEKLEDSLNKSAEESGAQKYAEEAKQLKAAASKLAELHQKEDALQKRTSKVRSELREQAQKRFEQKGGKQLADKLAAKVAEAKKQISHVEPRIADALNLEDTLDAAQERVADLERALKAGDFDEALDQAKRAQRAAEVLQSQLNIEDQIARLGQRAEVRKSLEAAAQAQQPLREVADALQAALPDEQSGMSAEQQKELQAQASEQQQLEQGMQGVREQISEVGKKVPLFGPQHEQLLQEAQQAMQQAGGKLQGRDSRGAQGAESEASDKMGKFEDAMKQLAKQSKGGPGGMPMPWGEPQGSGESGDEEGGDDVSREHVDIPDAESSRGPQEFRKKLLDAMKQPAPEKFKDKVRGYYEELVK